MKKDGRWAFIDLVGQKFNRLLVIKFVGLDEVNQRIWLCECDCGKFIKARSYTLKSGHTQSCGCLHQEIINNMYKVNVPLARLKNLTHGETVNQKPTPEFKAWDGMKYRCYNSKCKSYKNYGGRGITICNRWLESFENFLEDMGRRPTSQHSIDRIDDNGNYEPSNCKWSTPRQQIHNTRTFPQSNNHVQHKYWQGKLQTMICMVLSKRLDNPSLFVHYVGCTVTEFRDYIQSLWEPWMNWDNYGNRKGEWNSDHIIPVNRFDLSKEQDRIKCYNYKNTRPYDAIQNRKEHIR